MKTWMDVSLIITGWGVVLLAVGTVSLVVCIFVNGLIHPVH